MNTTRRGLAATALPLMILAGTVRGATAKSAGPLEASACQPGDGPKTCASGCPHCAALGKTRAAGVAAAR